MSEKTHLKCQHCGHEWNTKSQQIYVNCPKCLYKVRVRIYVKPEGE